jgi:hypothetical protein
VLGLGSPGEGYENMTADSILFAAAINITWHLVPLAAIISLVYSASRYEWPVRILRRSTRLFITIMFFMLIIFAVLWVLSFKL